MTSPISSGYVRGGGNTKRWAKLSTPSFIVSAEGLKDIDVSSLQPGAIIKVQDPPLHHATDPTQAESPTLMPTPEQMGYTGSTCVNCQGTRVVRTGHCETCQDCGETTACA